MKLSALSRKILPLGLLAAVLMLSGCADLFGSSSSSSSADNSAASAAPKAEYYYSNFADVPIPVEMKATKESYVVPTQGNVKVGMETFTGRVDVKSLNQAMIDYMARDGWGHYSGSHGPKQSVMVFVKDNILAVIITTDGTMNTEMRVYMTQKI